MEDLSSADLFDLRGLRRSGSAGPAPRPPSCSLRGFAVDGLSILQKPLSADAVASTEHCRRPTSPTEILSISSTPQGPPDSPHCPNKGRAQCCPTTLRPRLDSVQRPTNTDSPGVTHIDPNVVGEELHSDSHRKSTTGGLTVSTMSNASVSRTTKSQLEMEGIDTGVQHPPDTEVVHGVCPHVSQDEEGDAELVIPYDDNQKSRKKKKLVGKRKREDAEPLTCDLDEDLDRTLEDGAKQHNLTVVNVRNILHEVITNEHVVAMMKAAITESQGLPPFEPKMTRSKLKEVVEKGVVIPTWNLSPIKKSSQQQVPQFVDIPLEEEDSSDEEYRPEEEDEDETAEESLLESDVESTASSPRGHKRMRGHYFLESQAEERMDGRQQGAVNIITTESVPMGPPPPPKLKDTPDSAFMDKLHAVDEELDSHPVTIGSFQSLEENLIACRTRSKRPLKNVPIGQLEAELQAPDITPDMYEANTADDDNWKNWLRGLMHDDVGNDDEADDDDDPEYNILEDWDEPDTEDLRNDRAVRITKKEVNELMEELFETFQDEMGISHLEDEGADDEDGNTEPLLDFNTPQAITLEEPLLTEQHRTVRAQLEYLRMRKSLMRTEEEKLPAKDVQTPTSAPAPKLSPVMRLNCTQRERLQQQMQQHVQLLTQIHLLSFRNPKLCAEAETSQIYLAELSTFADSSSLRHGVVTPNFQSFFQACNLKDALQLIPLVHSQVPEDIEPSNPSKKTANDVPSLSQRTAWILATRSVFLYPELLPVCAMKPRRPQDRVFFTKAEDCLLALGLKHFENIDYCKQLISKYLMSAKTAQQLSARIKNLTMKKTPDNIIKLYKRTKMLPVLGRCCEDVLPDNARPPVEREKHRLPFWIKASLSSIETGMKKSSGSGYPLLLPPEILLTLKPLPKRFYWKSWYQKRSILKPLLIRPNPVPKQVVKPPAPQPLPIRILGQVPPLIQPAVTMQGIVNIQSLGVQTRCKSHPVPCVTASPRMSAYSTAATAPQTQVILPPIIAPRPRKSLICALPNRNAEAKTLGESMTPILQSTPVVFALPHGALKFVNLASACGVLQPLSTGSAVPMTTVLLSPTHVPLSQTPVSPPSAQTEPVVSNADDKKREDDDWEYVSITIKVKEESAAAQGRDQSTDVTEHLTIKEEETDVTPEKPQSGLHQSLTASSPVSKTQVPGDMEEPGEVNQTQKPEGSGESPKNTSSSADVDVEISSPGAAHRDSHSPAEGQDLCNDKDALEDDEDEDFDDLTQDEDEMSSEESVLSVPELQETMEKLTWLASERRLSQEGDSEENSQEENTEPEEEEEEEEGADSSCQKPEEMTDEAGDEKLLPSHHRTPSPVQVKTSMTPTERRRGGSKGQSSHRTRNRRGTRTRASKDTSKLLLLYDEKILTKDPLREQKDMAFAQSYLNRVRQALHAAPGTYQQFLNLIYEYETKGDQKTAVHLYESLRLLLHDWPQLLRDFAAFLLPEQALECGLFEEQQAFDKSRKFLRQLEICFQENPAQHQKIIRLLQSCAECPLQEMGKLKAQMWQLLKGHMHLQEEFSLFFDQLRPPASRMEDFEVVNWTENKEYIFDGFEEVTIPDVEEEEEQQHPKVSAAPRSKRRKDASHGSDKNQENCKDGDLPDGGKECPCSCHEAVVEQRMKRCKRRMCALCASKGCDSRSQRPADAGASNMKDAGDCRIPLPKNTSSDDRAEAQGPSISVQRSRTGADTGRVRHQTRGTSSRGARRHYKLTQCPSPSGPELRDEAPPPTSSALLIPTLEESSRLQVTVQEEPTLTMCAKNIKVSSSGEKVVLWTREADRVILTTCQEQGTHDDTFTAISAQLCNKSPSEVAQRFRELINLFQTGCITSSDDEDEGLDNVSDVEADEED
ncbi:GON-4-like protein isoform X1 [Dendrobates tinctorius]|uniref:GON-4-like protein isoform X1 n=1 Tax=Dendrobates tinctorius TaxID=92724 RepID=UPI003CCA517F